MKNILSEIEGRLTFQKMKKVKVNQRFIALTDMLL